MQVIETCNFHTCSCHPGTSDLADDLPDWLLIAEGRMRSPEPAPKIDQSFPLKPQQPGKGGPALQGMEAGNTDDPVNRAI